MCVFGFKWGCKSTKNCPGKLCDYIWWKIYQFTNVTNLPITKMCVLDFPNGTSTGVFSSSHFSWSPFSTSKLKQAATSDNLFIPSHQTYVRGMKKCLNGDVMEEVSPVLIKSLMTLGFWNGSMDSFHGNRWQETMDSTTKHGAFLWGFPSTNARMIWCWPISGCITWWFYRLMGWSCMW